MKAICVIMSQLFENMTNNNALPSPYTMAEFVFMLGTQIKMSKILFWCDFLFFGETR